VRYQFIAAHRDRYSVRRLCRALRVSESGYYAAFERPLSARGHRQAALITRIRIVHSASRATYGAPRVHAELHAQGETCCKNTVARLMQKAAIVPKTVRRFKITTDSRRTKAAPNLLGRVFSAAQPNECWLTDVTFIPTRSGWLYLAAILDLYSRAVVGWAMRERMDRQLVMDALGMALTRRGAAPDILHSDRGSLYAMADYRALLVRQGIRQSMSRKADCWDNAPMESFFHTLKTELVMHCDYLTREQARSSLFEYMEVFYNRQRRHSTLAYASPLDFETMNRPLIGVSTVRG
jgi:transposase InsO family protein